MIDRLRRLLYRFRVWRRRRALRENRAGIAAAWAEWRRRDKPVEDDDDDQREWCDHD